MSLRRSFALTFVSTNFATIIQFVSVVIISRLLTPAEIGIFSMTVLLTNIVAIFRDFGVSAYLQRESDLTEARKSSALLCLLMTSMLCAVILVLAADAVAAFYKEPGVGRVMHVTAISFVLVPFAAYQYSLIARDLNARVQAIVAVASGLIYACACVGFVLLEFSYMALAWANVVNIGCNIVLYALLAPGLFPKTWTLAHWREVVRFGGAAFMASLSQRINDALPEVYIGRAMDAHAVGIFSRASGVRNIIFQVLNPTLYLFALPLLARAHSEKRSLAPILLRYTEFITAIAWPPLLLIALFPVPVLGLLYGSQWLEAAPIVAALCLSSALTLGVFVFTNALLAIGRAGALALFGFFTVAIRVGLFFLIGTKDLTQFAYILLGIDVLSALVLYAIVARVVEVSIPAFLRAHVPSLKVIGLVALGLLAVKLAGGAVLGGAGLLLLVSAVTVLSWLAGVLLFGHPIGSELSKLLRSGVKAPWAARLADRFEARCPPGVAL